MKAVFNANSLSIWIITYNRPDSINRAVSDFLNSTPETAPINIISNHSKLELRRDYGSRVKVWVNTLRPDESWGYLARNWNQCLYLGLKDHEWVLCSQDDVHIKPGWLELVQKNPRYSFYTAPFFDMAFLVNREAFKRVGWFDERFLCVDLQDNDYLRRVYQRLERKKICIEDRHGWQLNGRPISHINPIGLSKYWIHGPDEGDAQPQDRPRGSDKIHYRINDAYRYAKWRIVGKANSQELNLKQRIPDIDWYPWFTKYIHEVTGDAYPVKQYLHSDWRRKFTTLYVMVCQWFDSLRQIHE